MDPLDHDRRLTVFPPISRFTCSVRLESCLCSPPNEKAVSSVSGAGKGRKKGENEVKVVKGSGVTGGEEKGNQNNGIYRVERNLNCEYKRTSRSEMQQTRKESKEKDSKVGHDAHR